MVKRGYYRYTVYLRGEGRKILDEIASVADMSKTDIIVVALKLLKHFAVHGVGESAIYSMPHDLWKQIYGIHRKWFHKKLYGLQ